MNVRNWPNWLIRIVGIVILCWPVMYFASFGFPDHPKFDLSIVEPEPGFIDFLVMLSWFFMWLPLGAVMMIAPRGDGCPPGSGMVDY